MINVGHSILLVAIASIVTIGLRAFPFLLFSGKRQMSDRLKNAVDKLPPAIMAILVVYCLKGDLFQLTQSALASALAIIGIVLIHLWKRNTLLSIAVGTVIYMVLIRIL